MKKLTILWSRFAYWVGIKKNRCYKDNHVCDCAGLCKESV